MNKALALGLIFASCATAAYADGELNLYSSRHYDTDEALYDNFEKQTGITINRIEDGADTLIARMQSEGELSPADLLLTVDAGRITRAADADLLQPLKVAAADEKVPDSLQDGDDLWTGVTTRARIIFYDKNDVTEPPQTYLELADPKYEGMICTRSSTNVYMIALLGSIIANEGEEAAKEWAEGVVNNFARKPQGGDTDQLRGIISGECDIVLSNDYYYARGFRKEVEGLTDGVDQIGYVFPNQDTTGTHINISGIGLAKHSPNPENARKFVEYLLTPEAQKMIADGNDEFPVVDGVAPSEAVQKMGDFKRDSLPLNDFAKNAAQATAIYNAAGYP